MSLMKKHQYLYLGNKYKYRYISPSAPVAQLDRALPSEGKGRTFESYRVRQDHLGRN